MGRGADDELRAISGLRINGFGHTINIYVYMYTYKYDHDNLNKSGGFRISGFGGVRAFGFRVLREVGIDKRTPQHTSITTNMVMNKNEDSNSNDDSMLVMATTIV